MQPMNDALVILPDDNNDGKADRIIEFAKVHNPVGFEFWNGEYWSHPVPTFFSSVTTMGMIRPMNAM